MKDILLSKSDGKRIETQGLCPVTELSRKKSKILLSEIVDKPYTSGVELLSPVLVVSM